MSENSFIDFDEMLECKLKESSLNSGEEQRIKSKMKEITDNVLEWMKVANTKEILSRLDTELKDTKACLQFKTKNIANSLNKEISEVANRIKEAILSNIELEKESLEIAKAEQKRLENIMNESTKPKTAMIKREQDGFISIFKRLWNERKENKQGLLGVLKATMFEIYTNNENKENGVLEEKNSIADLWAKATDKIKKLEGSIKKLSEQAKDVGKEFTQSGEELLSKLKIKYEKAITPDKVEIKEVEKENIDRGVER